jgi:lipopolysaccharide transport system permease protein
MFDETIAFNASADHPWSFSSLFISSWKNRRLVFQMAKREIQARYKTSAGGFAWSLISPILLLTVYTFVFSEVFKTRWNSADLNESKMLFALVLFVGLTIFSMFSEMINRAPTLITSNLNYVKKVVFPLEILPTVSLFVASFNAFVSLSILIVASAIFLGKLEWTALLLPLVWMPFLITLQGLSWMLSALGVYVRDLTQVVGSITMIFMFLSPVFYPVAAVPESFRPFLLANPLTVVIEHTRAVLIWGKVPNWSELGIYLVASLAILWIGYFFFQKTRKGFADVL